jgi:hypothetical protein
LVQEKSVDRTSYRATIRNNVYGDLFGEFVFGLMTKEC